MNNINTYFSKIKYQVSKSFSNESKSNISFFAIEGLVFALVINLINNNNNLFATRLGATDTQISLLTGIPQLVAMFMVIPGGIITDKFKNKRSMVALAMLSVAIIYVLIIFVPYLHAFKLEALIALLSIATGFITIYVASWQSYFSDVIQIRLRNSALSLRTMLGFFPAIAVPLITGTLLTATQNVNGKIKLHQSFFLIAASFIIVQIYFLFKVKYVPEVKPEAKQKTMQAIKESIYDLSHNKDFISFFVVIIIFYSSWYIDFATYYIGQVKYLKLPETFLSYGSIVSAVVQLASLAFWNKLNEKKGVRFSIIFAGVGLVVGSCVMAFTSSLPLSYGRYVFLALIAIANFAAVTIGLNIFQCLLQVLPERNKSVCISLYTMALVLSNAIMPMIGVALYKHLGQNLLAYQMTNLSYAVFRAVGTVLLVWRYMKLRHTPK